MKRPRSLFALLLTLCTAGALPGQEAPPRSASPPAAPAPAAADVRELPNLPYVANGTDRQRLDLYLPIKKGPKRPLIIWVHGGAWEAGSKNGGPGKALVPLGYAVASIGYRLSQQAAYPAQIEDCKAAIRWLRVHAEEYGIDPAHIGAWGASAGGHLVALLGTTGNIRDFDVGENLDQSSAVQCVLDWFGPTDFLHYGDPPKPELDQPNSAVARLLGGTVRENPEKARRASPVYFVKASDPPFLIMQGDKDPLVPLQQSQELQAALEKAGVESTLHVVPGAGHGGPGFNALPERKLMVEFFARHLHPAAAE